MRERNGVQGRERGGAGEPARCVVLLLSFLACPGPTFIVKANFRTFNFVFAAANAPSAVAPTPILGRRRFPVEWGYSTGKLRTRA